MNPISLSLICAAISIDIVVRLEVIYDLQTTNRREGLRHAAAVVGKVRAYT
jgi:hypothetical protein